MKRGKKDRMKRWMGDAELIKIKWKGKAREKTTNGYMEGSRKNGMKRGMKGRKKS